GVAPDVELDPMTADTLEMDLYRSEHALRERDLTKSLTGAAKHPTEQSFFKMRYNLPETERAKIRDRGGGTGNKSQPQTPLQEGRDLAGKMPQGKRQDQLRAVKSMLEKLQTTEVDSIAADLKRIDVDWAAPPKDAPNPPKPTDFEVTVKTDRPSDTVTSG